MRQVITGFRGATPRFTPFGISENMATHCTNCKLVSGEVRGIHQLTLLHDFADPDIYSAFRIPGAGVDGADLWMGFNSKDAIVVRTPTTNDSFERYYWHEPGQPIKYAPLSNLQAGGPYYNLGVPQPDQTPSIAIAGGSGDQVTRAYTYTFVSAYGEEGPPANPVTAGPGFDNATWTISNMDATPADAANRNIVSKNIYRTVSSASNTAEFYFVANVPLATTSYGDTKTDLTVATTGRIMESTSWFPPPADLTGIVAFPGGVLLGWKGETVYMSVPYRPHAWPTQFQVSVEQPIIGIGVTGNTAVVCTDGRPFAITMTTPDSAALQKIDAAEPCLSRGSIVGSPEGVFYASQNGLMVFSGAGFQNASRAMITKEEWLQLFNPAQLRACRYQTHFIGITEPGVGYVIDAETSDMTVIELTDLSGANNILNDIWTGEVFMISNGQVSKWDDANGPEITWRWASKRFFFPYEINIGAARIGTQKKYYSDVAPLPPDEPMSRLYIPPEGTEGSLHNIIPVLPPWAMFGLRIYIDGGLVYDRWVRTGNTLKLPSGFKSQDWQFELYGKVPMAKFEFAETAKELAMV